MSELDELAREVTRAAEGAASALRGAGAPTEELAELIPAHRVLLIPRPATMRQLGQVWRLGTLLLGASDDIAGSLFATGRTTRSQERGRPNHQSVSREERRDIAAAALRGGYPEGTQVNFDAPLLLGADPDPTALETLVSRADVTSPIGVANGAVRVRWRAGAPLDGAPELSRYLAERVSLIVDPPI